jgi:hypothetical protein
MNEFDEVILKYSSIDRSFLMFVDDDKFPKIETGIVFILATWSGASLVQFSVLTETLSNLKNEKLKIYVLDTDKLNQEDLNQIGILPQGWGETFWIKNYKIEHFLDNKECDVSKIVLYTNEIFAR